VYKRFYVFDFIAHCWATFSALRALLSSHIMTNKDDDDDDDDDDDFECVTPSVSKRNMRQCLATMFINSNAG